MHVTLEEYEIATAHQVAQQRNASQREAGLSDSLVKGNSLGRDKEDAEAELAVSKALNLAWDGRWLPIKQWDSWKIDGNDVGRLEVRSTGLAMGRLILHPSDKDHSPYLLVRSYNRPEFELVGWMYGYEGKQQKFWRSNLPRPCFMINYEELRSVDDFIELLRVH